MAATTLAGGEAPVAAPLTLDRAQVDALWRLVIGAAGDAEQHQRTWQLVGLYGPESTALRRWRDLRVLCPALGLQPQWLVDVGGPR